MQLYRWAKSFDPERPCYYSDGVTATGLGTTVPQILGPELTVETLACRNGANSSSAGCFADVLVTQAGWGHAKYPPSWFNPLWQPAGPPGSRGPPFFWYSPDDGSHLPADLPVPSIVHEAYDGRTFPRLETNRDSFTGSIVKGGELYCDQSIRRLDELNLLHENHLWAQASEELYTQWAKVYIEGYHLDPSTSGYQWWVGYDWFGLSNGIVGGHENEPRPKPGISNATLRSVQREIMLLTPDPLLIQTSAWEAGQHISLPVLLQNLTFGGFPSWRKGARLVWTATTMSDGRIVARGQQPIAADTILQGDIGLLANASFSLPSTDTYDTVTVRVELALDGDTWSNSWDLGVFPRAGLPPGTCTVPVFASRDVLAATRQQCSNAAPMPASNALPHTPFVVVAGNDGMDEATAAALSVAGGAAVLLNPPATGSFPAYTGLHSIGTAANVDGFHQPWWSSPGSTCTLAYNSTLVRDGMKLRGSFVPFPFSELITNATAYVLDNVSASAVNAVQVHLRNVPVAATDKTVCNGGNGCGAQMTTVSNQALVLELPVVQSVAAGAAAPGASILISGLFMFNASALPKSPQARWAFASLVAHAVDKAKNKTTTKSDGLGANLKSDDHVSEGRLPPQQHCPCVPASLCRPLSPQPNSRREVFAYHGSEKTQPPNAWSGAGAFNNGSSWRTYDWTKVTSIGLFATMTGAEGWDLLCTAHKHGVRVLPWSGMAWGKPNPIVEPYRAYRYQHREVYSNTTYIDQNAKLAAAFVISSGFDGILLDAEGLRPYSAFPAGAYGRLRTGLVYWVSRLRTELDKVLPGGILTWTVDSNATRADKIGRTYDFAGLAQAGVDYFQPMEYCLSGDTPMTGRRPHHIYYTSRSNDPIWTLNETVQSFAKYGINASRLVMLRKNSDTFSICFLSVR